MSEEEDNMKNISCSNAPTEPRVSVGPTLSNPNDPCSSQPWSRQQSEFSEYSLLLLVFGIATAHRCRCCV